jgi:glyoxylate/hydroxypyruvate reductase A
MRILVCTNFNREQQLKLKNGLPQDAELYFESDLTKEAFLHAFKSAEIILGNPPAVLFQDTPSKLVFWQIDSAGFDQYQHLNLTVPVANMGNFFARSCAETIVAGVLSFYRQIHLLIRLQREKQWQGKQIRTTLQSLNDKKVLILGTGAIGTYVKKLLLAFGCEIKTTARKSLTADLHRFEDVLVVLPETDLIINTLPGTAENYASAAFFDAVKPGSVYANIGRGNTTDEKALISALQNGVLAGAVLDVTEVEPLPQDHVLWDMENVILTQHTGGGDINEAEGKVQQFISNVNKFIKGKEVEDLVDLKQGY